MDQRLKSLLERAEAWPPEAQVELFEAATRIDKRLEAQTGPKVTEQTTISESALEHGDHSIIRALFRAPRVDLKLVKRGLLPRIRELKFP